MSRTTSISTPERVKAWRVTTAARVFVLALALGQTLTAGSLGSVGVLLGGLTILTVALCAVEAELPLRALQWTAVAEGMLAAVLLTTTDAPVAPLLVYLALPPVLAGVRHGWVTTANTTLATGVTLAGASAAAETLGRAAPQVLAALPWLMVGLGAGLLAAWLTRSARDVEQHQAAYLEAHRLLTQLRTLTSRLPRGLDSRTVAEDIVTEIRAATDADRVALLLGSTLPGITLIAECGAPCSAPAAEDATARRCMETRDIVEAPGEVAFPLRVGSRTIGSIVVGGPSVSGASLDLPADVDPQALRLDAALLFEEVRALATTEERNRLAREIHDGVAQEVASLGYLADELAATSTDPASQAAAHDLRSEVTRVVSELRLSIFDLRHGPDESGGLGRALSDYARELGRQTDVRVHLSLDERGVLPTHTQAELLRIAQEAMANARQHAQATGLWVLLTTDGRQARLEVIDNGTGTTRPRRGHYGLATMRERAERIDADLTIAPMPDQGTRVTVQTRTTGQPTSGGDRAHLSAARR